MNNYTIYESVTLECQDCFREFVWTSGEREYYASQNPPLRQPKRCKACREARRAQRRPGN